MTENNENQPEELNLAPEPEPEPKPKEAPSEHSAEPAEEAPKQQSNSAEQIFNNITSDSKLMALFSHILGLFFGFVPSLVIWLIKKDEDEFIEDQAKEALNFQLTLTAAALCCIPLFFLAPVILPAIWLSNLIFSIVGAVKSYDGHLYRYPWSIKFIK